MPDYRRSFIPGGTYFFTVVTYHRLPILTSSIARKLLRSAFLSVNDKWPFINQAICLLPDHLHCIWSLPEGDANYPLRWREIKRLFTMGYLEQIGSSEVRNSSREKRREAAIWERRFWEHTLRDQKDYHRHIDYIHYNPVKHGLVQNMNEWPWSSYHRFEKEIYRDDAWMKVASETKNMSCGE